MPNADHVGAVQSGKDALHRFRTTNPGVLDLTDARLAGLNLDEMNLSGANLCGADLSRCQGNAVNLSHADLSHAKLSAGRFSRANLESANLSGSEIHGATLDGAKLQNANLSNSTWARTNLTSADFTGASVDGASFALAMLQQATITPEQISKTDVKGANLRLLDLTGIDLSEREMSYTDFSNCQLTGANLSRAKVPSGKFSGAALQAINFSAADLTGADFVNASLSGANLAGAKLMRANLQQAQLNGVNITKADFYEANLSNASLQDVVGAYRARHLLTTRIEPDVFYFPSVSRPWPERWVDWERIRIAGRLPLLGVSYTGLITIPVFVYALGIYNENVDLLRTWIGQTENTSAGMGAHAASVILDHLHARPIPSRFLVLFLATLCLAVASTIYALACPSRIKEFSRDQWCDELRHSLVHYWPEAWKRRVLRFACALLYMLGGAGALYALSDKLSRVAVILYYSASPFS
jgi:uncharacterized protein YjbI with pentapeptide repeats